MAFEDYGLYDDTMGGMSKFDTPTPSVPTQSASTATATGNMSTGLSSDAIGAIGSGLGGAADIGLNIYGAYQTNKENERAGAESRQLAEVTRRDELKQQRTKNIIEQKSFEQEEEQFEIEKWISSQDMRQKIYVQKLKSLMENRAKMISGFKKMKESTSKNSDIRNILLQSFGRK